MKILCNLLFLGFALFSFTKGFSQKQKIKDSIVLDYSKIYAFCMDANIKPVLPLFDLVENKLSVKDKNFKNEFENRFKYDSDVSDYLNDHESKIDCLLLIYHSYWRKSLLEPSLNYDNELIENLIRFFKIGSQVEKEEELFDSLIKKFVKSKGYYSDGFGEVGRLKDLMVWRKQNDTTYTFSIYDDKISVRVFMLRDFVTLGWGEYATVGKHIGGWATDEALFVLKRDMTRKVKHLELVI